MMLLSFIFVILSVYGLGSFCPVPRAELGVRLAFGVVALTLLLGIGGGLLGAPMRIGSFAVAGIALLGLAKKLIFGRPALWRKGDILHPATALAILASVVFAVAPDVYLPVAWDEFSGWLRWTRQIAAGNSAAIHADGYTLGWPLLMAYPQALGNAFNEGWSFPSIVALHIAVLGLIADFARHLALRQGESDLATALISWGTVAAILAAEAMWTLFPSLLLIEKPQLYAFISALIFAAWMTDVEDKSAGRWAVVAGLALAAAYLMKIAAITLIPAIALALLTLAVRRGVQKGIIAAIAILTPILALAVWWSQAFQSGGGCLSSPLAILTGFADRSAETRIVAAGLAEKLAAYYAGYKPVISIAAIAGLALGARHRIGLLAAAMLVAFAAAYLASMLFTYVGCFGGITKETLDSHERYGRVLLRIIHTFGLMFLVAAIGRWIFQQAGRVPPRRIAAAAAIILSLFFLREGFKAHATMKEVSVRARDGERGAIVANAKWGSETILRWVESRHDGAKPVVMLVAQMDTGFYRNIVAYHGQGLERGKPGERYEVQAAYSFGPSKANVWMTVASPAEIRELAGKADVVWPIALDPYTRDALAPILAACPNRAILAREKTGWTCLGP